MKRIQMTLLGIIFGGLISTASAQTVYSNMVGFQKVRIQQGQQVMASTPFDNVTSTFKEVFSGQIAPGVIDTAADNILKWDTATSQYRIFYQIEILGNPGPFVEKGGDIADDEAVTPGEGFWIVNSQNPGENTVVFFGEVPTDPTRTINIQPGLQMVHNPYPAAFSIGDEAISNLKSQVKGATIDTQADLIFQWNPEFSAYDTYWLLDTGATQAWVYQPADPNAAGGLDELMLEPGAAVWIQRFATESAFNWVINRPYAVP